MSHVHDGPLATYNSLSDDHLSGYFANSRMRRHLRKSGLISRGGQIVSESTYRLNMSRKEHKKHVKDMLAQAIVHKTLDLERSRQSDIKKKLEEIAKIQLVRRVRVLYLDDEGRPLTPVHNDHNFGEQNQIDTRHLHTMDTAALRKYAMLMATMEEGRGVTSPYMLSQVPLPPKTPMSSRTPRSARRVQSASPQRPVTTDSRIARLHRPETAKVHYGDQQTMCKVLMKYHGWALKLAREKMDPTQEVVIEQQHCGGNTLTVFKDRLLPGSAFEFISYRHRGYPFSLSLYVDGQMDSRVSTCCEYRHKRGAKIGGKQGHFSVLKVEGAVPCYKCQVAKGVVMRNKATSKKPKRAVKPHKEEVIVVSTARDDYDNEYLERRVEEPKPSSEDTKEKAVVVAVEKEEKDADDRKLKSAKSADASYDDDFEASSKTSDSSSSSSDSESETESSTRKDEGGDNNQEARGEDSEAVSPSPRASDQRAVQSPSPRFKSPRVEVNGTGRDIDDYSSDGGQENKDKVVSMEDVEAETKPIGRRGSSSSSSSSPSSSSSASGTPRAHDSQRQRDDNAVVSMAILDKEEDKKKERERQDEARRREREEQLQQQREERDKRQEEARQREEQRRQELQYREQERQEESRKREEQRKLAEEKERQRRQEEEENRRKAALMEEDPELKDQERMKAQRLREAQILEEQIQREATRQEEERAREQRFREEEARRVEQREREEADRDRRRQELEESMSRTGSSTARSTSSAATGSSASTSASSSPQTTPRRAPQTQDETQTPRDASPQRVDPYLLGAKPQEDQLPPRPVSPFPDAAVYVARPKRHEPVPEPAVYQPRSRPTQEATSPEQAPREEETEQQDTFRSSASETNPSSSQYSASDSEEDEEQEELARPKTAAGGRLRDGRRLSDEVTLPTPVPPPDDGTSDSSSDSSDSSTNNDTNRSTDVSMATPRAEDRTASQEGHDSDRRRATSESDGDNMHGGADPDNVAQQETLRELRPLRPQELPAAKAHDGKVVELLTSPESVELSNVLLNKTQVYEVASHLEQADTVKMISLCNTGLDDDDMQRLSEAMVTSPSEPVMVNLSLNCLTEKSIPHVLQTLKAKPSIKILILQSNPLGDQGVQTLTQGLQDLHRQARVARKAQALDSARSLDSMSVDSNASLLDVSQRYLLQELDLADTGLTDRGAGHVADMMAANVYIQALSLNHNTRVTAERGWRHIGEALGKNRCLKTLSLDGNLVGDEGVEHLAMGLRNNRTVTAVELEDAGIGTAGGKHLLELLKRNTSILELTVSPGNTIPEEERDNIIKYISLNRAPYNNFGF
ncbi:glutamate-rich protein 3-like isoform X3 [Littorina saxatilis]|uniref:glutamate-rich protein 3-like isoform X3 n=1 Tax=Littorina saxatilis TaxID=31220 RepID=UPI0038B5C4E9